MFRAVERQGADSRTALINGKRVDVITEGSHIERGTPVIVVALEGMRVVVRAI